MPDRETIQLGGHSLDLLAGRAVWWGTQRTVFVADLHLGKAAAFRAGGVATPETTTAKDLERLSRVVEETGAERLVVLGDLVHSRHALEGAARDAFDAWVRARAALEIVCLLGNHDRSAKLTELGEGVRIVEEPHGFEGITLVHDPALADGVTPTLAGHLHPGVRLGRGRGATRMGMRAACYWRTGRTLVLPAFGGFTGLKIVRPRPGEGSVLALDVPGATVKAGSAAGAQAGGRGRRAAGPARRRP